MKIVEHLPALRLATTGLKTPSVQDVAALLRRSGPLQAQEEHHAKTALALRLRDGTDAMIDRAIADRTIVRTWLMRGTLHFVAATDLRWITHLLGPGLMRSWVGTFEKGGLDAATRTHGYNVLREALPGAGPVLRQELVARLAKNGIDMKGPYSSRIFSCAAYESLICCGPTLGKQETFVWLDDWVPMTAALPRAEAVAALARRYFQSHGPATIDDFVNWSGLGLREARAGVEALGVRMSVSEVDGSTWHHPEDLRAKANFEHGLRFLPGFDEYLLGYKDRSHILAPNIQSQVVTSNGIFRPVVLIDGIVRGTWQRKAARDRILVEITWLGAAPSTSADVIEAALAPLASVWGFSVQHSIVSST